MNARAFIVDAFSTDGRGGNPAGVVLDADGLAPHERQAIAAKIGLSETAFISASTVASARVEFFTPSRQIAHCGHATVAAFSLLREQGRLAPGAHRKESIDGLREVDVGVDDVALAHPAPRVSALDPARHPTLAAMLGLSIEHFDAALPAQLVDSGNRFVHVALRSSEVLRASVPDHAAIARLSEELDLVGLYLFHRSPGDTIAAQTRMYAPRYGIPEESATGVAAAGLAALLQRMDAQGAGEFRIAQGDAMPDPSPSRITARIELRDGAIARVWTRGQARIRAEVSI